MTPPAGEEVVRRDGHPQRGRSAEDQPSPPEDAQSRHQRELAEARRELAALERDAQRAAQKLERSEAAVADAQRQLDAATQRRDTAARHAQLAERAHRDAQSEMQHLADPPR